MRFLVSLWIALAALPSPTQSERVRKALRRIDLELQGLERAGLGERGRLGVTGPAGPPGLRGPRCESGAGADLSNLDELSVGNGTVALTIERDCGVIQIKNTDRKTRFNFFVRGTDDSGFIGLDDSRGKRRASTKADEKGRLFFGTCNGRHHGVGFLGEGSDTPSGCMYLADRNGERRVEPSVDNNGNGNAAVNGETLRDVAEVLELATREGIRPVSVVAFDAVVGGPAPASEMNANLVVGVTSGTGAFRPGMVIGSRADCSRDLPVAMGGLINARKSVEGGAVEPGDLLVPSSDPGVGMRAGDPVGSFGRVFVKALEPCFGIAEEGLVLMLAMNRQPGNV